MNDRNRHRIAALLVLATLFAGCRARPLWTVAKGRDLTKYRHHLPEHHQPVIVDSKAVASGDDLSLDLFGKEAIAKRSDDVTSKVGEGAFVGSLADEPASSVVLASEGGLVSGTIVRGNGRIFSLRPLGDDVSAVAELPPLTEKTQDAPPLAPPRAMPHAQALAEPKSMRDQPCVGEPNSGIDVGFLYTRAAEIGAAGAGGINAAIKELVVQANTTFLFSGLPRSVNRLAQDRIDFVEKPTLEEDLKLLQSQGSPLFAAARKMRERVGADVVVLIVEDGDVPGLSYVMEQIDQSFSPFAFMVVRREAAAAYFTFTHELGHLLGARHDWRVDPTNNRPDDHNHGFAQTVLDPPPASTYLTVMAAAQSCAPGLPCMRLLRWSDPNPNRTVEVDHHRLPLGVLKPQPTNDRETVDRAAATVARFRCRQ